MHSQREAGLSLQTARLCFRPEERNAHLSSFTPQRRLCGQKQTSEAFPWMDVDKKRAGKTTSDGNEEEGDLKTRYRSLPVVLCL